MAEALLPFFMFFLVTLPFFMWYNSSTALANVFDTGKYHTELNKSEVLPPKPLLIAHPLEAGEFPVLLFLHGFCLYNSFYSHLIQHIASHGFIVIAPQLYIGVVGLDASDEINSTAKITNWLPEGLSKLLPPNVRPDFSKLALAGHSRGGKTAFALALRKLNITTSLKFSALIGVDPVDGLGIGIQTSPPVLTNHSFDFDMAALIIGSGYGEYPRIWPLAPPCAPKRFNHEQFYNECQKPAWHFVAKYYGHLDMLDDDTGVIGFFTHICCKNGKSRKPMRRFVGGVIVAFLKAYLHHDTSDLYAIINKREIAPVEFTSDHEAMTFSTY